MAERHLEDKCPILKCSVCDFEVKSVSSMENHASAVHGLKLRLEIIDSNNTESPVTKKYLFSDIIVLSFVVDSDF